MRFFDQVIADAGVVPGPAAPPTVALASEPSVQSPSVPALDPGPPDAPALTGDSPFEEAPPIDTTTRTVPETPRNIEPTPSPVPTSLPVDEPPVHVAIAPSEEPLVPVRLPDSIEFGAPDLGLPPPPATSDSAPTEGLHPRPANQSNTSAKPAELRPLEAHRSQLLSPESAPSASGSLESPSVAIPPGPSSELGSPKPVTPAGPTGTRSPSPLETSLRSARLVPPQPTTPVLHEMPREPADPAPVTWSGPPMAESRPRLDHPAAADARPKSPPAPARVEPVGPPPRPHPLDATEPPSRSTPSRSTPSRSTPVVALARPTEPPPTDAPRATPPPEPNSAIPMLTFPRTTPSRPESPPAAMPGSEPAVEARTRPTSAEQRSTTPDPFGRAERRGLHGRAPARRTEPTVHIGRIDIVVEAPPPAPSPPANMASPAADITSRRYLRRL